MKLLFAILLLLPLAALASQHNDTLDTYSQYGHQYFYGHITDFDKEDTVKQIEINDAANGQTGFDLLFYDDFELHQVNWIWVGDDTNGNEFGFAAHCEHESDSTDHDGNLHVVLSGCYIVP